MNQRSLSASPSRNVLVCCGGAWGLFLCLSFLLLSACSSNPSATPTPEPRPEPQPEPALVFRANDARADIALLNRQAEELFAMWQVLPGSNPSPSDQMLARHGQYLQELTDGLDAQLYQMRLDFLGLFDELEPSSRIAVRFLDVHMRSPVDGLAGTTLSQREDGVQAWNHASGGSCTLSFTTSLENGPALVVRFRLLNQTDSNIPAVPFFGVSTGERKQNLGAPNRRPVNPDRVHEVYLYRLANNKIAYCYTQSTEEGGRSIGPVEFQFINEGQSRFYLAMNRSAKVLIEEVRAP